MKFSKLSGAVFDMDGVLWRGDEPLEGMTDLFAFLQSQQIPFALATNNSSKTRADYVAKLERMGVSGILEGQIVTAATATANFLQKHYPAGTRIYVLGMKGIRSTLAEAGFDVVPPDDSALDSGLSSAPVSLVVAGVDFELTYESLKRAALHIRNGAEFIGTNPDKTFPAPEGLVPGAGSMLAALEAATDVAPTIIGKPAPPMFEAALDALGLAAADVVMVGDRLNTDIQGAQAVGMQTILLFTGVSKPEDLISSEVQPDVAYEDLPALIRSWAGDAWWVERQREKRKRGT